MATVAVDPYPDWTADQVGGYANNAFAITPSDTNELPTVINKLFVGMAGSVSIVLVGDTVPVVLTGLLAGTVLKDFRIRAVKATNTTALTGLVGAY